MVAASSVEPAHDLTKETMLSLAQAARKFPPARLSRPVNASTVWRWCRKGVTLRDGTKVRLEAVRVSGRWLTSEEAISRFVARQTPPATEQEKKATQRTPEQRRRAACQAGKALEKLGL